MTVVEHRLCRGVSVAIVVVAVVCLWSLGDDQLADPTSTYPVEKSARTAFIFGMFQMLVAARILLAVIRRTLQKRRL